MNGAVRYLYWYQQNDTVNDTLLDFYLINFVVNNHVLDNF